MKKSIIASIIALGVLGGTAHAANEVTFLGSVSATTCDLTTSVNGAAQPNQVVQLGTVQANQPGNFVDFAMKPVDPNAQGCANRLRKRPLFPGLLLPWMAKALGQPAVQLLMPKYWLKA